MLTAYMDGVLCEALLPEPVATELRLLSSMLLQILGLQGQAFGRSLAILIVVHRQLWLSQARAPHTDKAVLLDESISTGDLAEIPLRRQGVPAGDALLPPCAPVWCRSNRWQASPTCTVTWTVPVHTALLGDLRHRLQGTPAANNRAHPSGRGNPGRGQPTHQHPRRRF
ncbi:UNVERIFIED_CONTAM: hypothetical protein FKN15_066017 [Acipenser sinensis]